MQAAVPATSVPRSAVRRLRARRDDDGEGTRRLYPSRDGERDQPVGPLRPAHRHGERGAVVGGWCSGRTRRPGRSRSPGRRPSRRRRRHRRHDRTRVRSTVEAGEVDVPALLVAAVELAGQRRAAGARLLAGQAGVEQRRGVVPCAATRTRRPSRTRERLLAGRTPAGTGRLRRVGTGGRRGARVGDAARRGGPSRACSGSRPSSRTQCSRRPGGSSLARSPRPRGAVPVPEPCLRLQRGGGPGAARRRS